MSLPVETTMFKSFYFVLILHVAFLLATVHAQDDQSDFISIDCGITKGTNYTDSKTGLNYVSDASFIDSGVSQKILPSYNSPTLDFQLTTLTSFPKSTRNCYTLRPKQGKGNRYLIRARFFYGNYDFKGQFPEFDLYMGSDYWYTVNITESIPMDYEIIHLSSSDYIYVCLVNIGLGNPFISALELRLLDSSMYGTRLQSMILAERSNYGSSVTVRYPDDKYDRIWSPTTSTSLVAVYTSGTVSSGSSSTEKVPSKVMSTAFVYTDPTGYIYDRWTATNATEEYIVYLYIAEIEPLEKEQKREFNIYLNDEYWDGPVSPLDHTTSEYFSTCSGSLNYNFTLYPTKSSTLAPIFNAMELYNPKQFLQQQTEDQDAAAIWSTKSTYRLTRNWQGDPCLPHSSVWDGINCSYNDSENPRIISLNLSSSGLSGEIADALANFTMIKSLDLSYNNLIGSVPKFLASLDFLKTLNLTGNNFTRPLPAELLAKSKKGSLLLIIEDISNQDKGSCPTDSCKKNKHNKVVIPVIAIVAALFMLLTILAITWIIKRRQTKEIKNADNPGDIAGSRNQRFTFLEIQSITDSFNTAIGKGGFGTVFYGSIGNNQVAVKMLSESSAQGYREFQAEVRLLMSVHHKNLTPLVGYCDEGSQKGIIYEYMANGNLGMHLFGGSPNVLSWKKRLEIGYDAAQGLEYMHHGCKPSLVHRDVKCSNILLNENLQAKLADFGLSRAFATESSTHVSTAIAGTPGYLDPEYYTTCRLTEKSDVYSFGVVLLEMITGRPAISEDMYIVNWVKSMIAAGNIENIIDPRLHGDFDINTAWKVVELAITCVDSISSKRPTMNDVVTDIKSCLKAEKGFHGAKPNVLDRHMSLSLESMQGPNLR